MSLLSAKPWIVLDVNDAPLDGLAGSILILDYVTRQLVDRTKPSVIGVGGGSGLYTLIGTAADVAAGTIYVIDNDPTGANNVRQDLRFWVGRLGLSSDPLDALLLVKDDATGLWNGAAPTLAVWRNVQTQADQLPHPALTPLRPYLFALQPTLADLNAGVAYRVDGPANASPVFWEGGFGPLLSTPQPAVGGQPKEIVFRIGDSLPALAWQLLDRLGAAVPSGEGSVYFNIASADGGATLLSILCDVVDAALGKVQVEFPVDLGLPSGNYLANFVLTAEPTSSAQGTFPYASSIVARVIARAAA